MTSHQCSDAPPPVRRSSGHGGQSERAPAGQRLMRKRSWSVHGDWRGLKRRRKGIVPPTKFLLGGNICDPLNLGSLNDEEANRWAEGARGSEGEGGV